MRYYEFALSTTPEQIKEMTDVNLRDYAYDSTIAAVNSYMYKKMKNDLQFQIYRDEEESLLATFAYNDKSGSFEDAYEYILDMLREAFHIKRVKAEPVEITMYQYYDCIREAKRRDYGNWAYRHGYNDWFYDHFIINSDKNVSNKYAFEERIIPLEVAKEQNIYDQSFIDEIKNIAEHENVSGVAGNMVHYVIAGNSIDAACDMTETLMSRLYNANRITSRRMEVVSNIDPDMYKGNSHIEDIIENNYGGVIVFDLTEKFGNSPSEYLQVSKYIETLFRQYRNKCLFVFTYNMDNPGFSYYILPELKKYAIMMPLKEGRGDRKAAINYMKHLIKGSEYAKYAHQAREYMKDFPGDDFSQSDVLAAYEQFEAWCVNKNIFKAYDFGDGDRFMLDRDATGEPAYEKLQKLIGLEVVKKQIDNIIASSIIDRERRKQKGKDYQTDTMHMVFAGNPGTAKTTVAKLFARIAKDKGLLKSGTFVERGGMDLNHEWLVREAFRAAKGGVLFIDEAYSMYMPDAIAALIQELENRRDEVIVIFAGYNDDMKAFLERNEGMKSRIPHWVDFPDYSTEELTEIFKFMVAEKGFTATEGAVKEARHILQKMRYIADFGNGRYARNMLNRAIQNQAVRLLDGKADASSVKKKKIFVLEKEDITAVGDGLKDERPYGTAQKELDDMIGLASVKDIIRKIVATCKMNKLWSDKGKSKERPSMHMVFTGNPGTAKTTVARLLAEIMRDEKILPTGSFVEVGKSDLVGIYAGQTPRIVKRKFKEAQGGVLFIDEAYSLWEGVKGGYGDDAINTIVQEMENHREDTVVIFAGYPNEMKEFMERNPGMKSRVAFHIDFQDYTADELCDITKLMVNKKEMRITDAALEKLKGHYASVNKEKDYGNGRFVRKMLEEAEMNLAERLSSLDEDELTDEMMTTIEEADVPDVSYKSKVEARKIGFAS